MIKSVRRRRWLARPIRRGEEVRFRSGRTITAETDGVWYEGDGGFARRSPGGPEPSHAEGTALAEEGRVIAPPAERDRVARRWANLEREAVRRHGHTARGGQVTPELREARVEALRHGIPVADVVRSRNFEQGLKRYARTADPDSRLDDRLTVGREIRKREAGPTNKETDRVAKEFPKLSGDRTTRLVAADALQEAGFDDAAAMLREGRYHRDRRVRVLLREWSASLSPSLDRSDDPPLVDEDWFQAMPPGQRQKYLDRRTDDVTRREQVRAEVGEFGRGRDRSALRAGAVRLRFEAAAKAFARLAGDTAGPGENQKRLHRMRKALRYMGRAREWAAGRAGDDPAVTAGYAGLMFQRVRDARDAYAAAKKKLSGERREAAKGGLAGRAGRLLRGRAKPGEVRGRLKDKGLLATVFPTVGQTG